MICSTTNEVAKNARISYIRIEECNIELELLDWYCEIRPRRAYGLLALISDSSDVKDMNPDGFRIYHD